MFNTRASTSASLAASTGSCDRADRRPALGQKEAPRRRHKSHGLLGDPRIWLLDTSRPLHPRSPQFGLARRRNSVESLVEAGDNDDTQHNTRRLICVSLHPGTLPEQQVFLHFGCRRPEIPLHKMRDLCPAGRDETGSAGADLPHVAGRGCEKLSVTFRYHVSNHRLL